MKLEILALLCLCSASLLAQEQVQKIPASFYAFDYVAGHETVEIQTGANAFEEVRLSTANIVGPITAISAGGMLRIHAKPVTVEGIVTHPVLSVTKIPAGIRRALVVLFPNPKNPKEPYRSLVLDHGLKGFPLGVYRLINVSPYPVRGIIGRETAQVKPGGIAQLELMGEPGATAQMRFEFFDKNRWNLLTESRCAIRKDRRWLACIYSDPATGRMNIRSIPDRTATPAATPAPEPAPD
jgi:hypothetical protein